jgi:outer membrane usher protein
MNYVHIVNRNELSSSLLTASYSRNIFLEISLSLTATRSLSGSKNNSVFLSLSRAFDKNLSANLSNSQTNSIHQSSVQLLRALPQGPGYGYSLTGGTGTMNSSNIKQGSLSLQNNMGTYIGQVNESPGQLSYSLNVSGSAVLLGGKPYLTHNLYNGSFGVVQVSGIPDIDVYANNQVISRTDKNGNALVPNLLPYQETVIAIDVNQIPLNVAIDSASLTVAPYYSSGIMIRFPVKVIRGCTLIVKQAVGENVPEGAMVTVGQPENQFIVGSGGEVYLTGLDNENNVDISWESHHCQFSFTLPPVDEKNPIPELGTFICKEIADEKGKLAPLKTNA